ncbi:MAG: hypothetical protein WAN35_06150 [Terracidiphilus sp.]
MSSDWEGTFRLQAGNSRPGIKNLTMSQLRLLRKSVPKSPHLHSLVPAPAED